MRDVMHHKKMEDQAEIRRVRETDVASLCDAINSVCAEKRYVATVGGFTVEQTAKFVARILKESLPQFVAVNAGQVIGWCDIIPPTMEGFTHVGRLGMGVKSEHRGQGIGRRLLSECLRAARARGIEKIELEVYSDNSAAIHLYETEGFEKEGLRKRGRKLEHEYQDVQIMGLLLTNKDA
jgi:ribosomal protein S18 acetylase RimI-like enzyme